MFHAKIVPIQNLFQKIVHCGKIGKKLNGPKMIDSMREGMTCRKKYINVEI